MLEVNLVVRKRCKESAARFIGLCHPVGFPVKQVLQPFREKTHCGFLRIDRGACSRAGAYPQYESTYYSNI